MSNCQCIGIERFFDVKQAKKDLKKYRKNGAQKATKTLINAISSHNINSFSLLDIGGGIGAIQHELLKKGVLLSTDVDASSAYLEKAKEESFRQGTAEKTKFYFGDFVEIANTIAEADIVTLDRVICCYDEMEKLVNLSADKAKVFYGIIFPIDKWIIKKLHKIFNLGFVFERNSMRVFIHSTEKIEEILKLKGFENIFHKRYLLWQVILFKRKIT